MLTVALDKIWPLIYILVTKLWLDLHNAESIQEVKKMERKNGFSLVELLVVIAIIGIMTLVLFPVFARARDKARTATCQSNLKQLGVSFQMYAQDHDGNLPLAKSANPFKVILPYSYHYLCCPEFTQNLDQPTGVGYGVNQNLPSIKRLVSAPASTALLADSRYDKKWFRDRGGVSRRHEGIANIGFADGHVKSYQTFEGIIFKPQLEAKPVTPEPKFQKHYQKGDIVTLGDGSQAVVFQAPH